MNPKAKALLELVLLAIVVGFAGAFGIRLALMIGGGDPKGLEMFLGGFFGAFFAFLFVRLGEFLTKVFERSRKNTEALMALQHEYIEIDLAYSDNQHSLATFSTLADRKLPTLWADRLHVKEPPRDLLLSLTNIDLMNDLSDVHSRLRRLNSDLEALMRAYDRTAEIYLKERDVEAYKAGLKSLTERSLPTAVFLTREREELSKALASIRVILAGRPIGEKFASAIVRDRYPRDFVALRDRALRELTEEAIERSADNAARIAEVQREIEAARHSSRNG